MRVVTIDGPAGAGKSTVARGWRTGWAGGSSTPAPLYRAVTLAAIRSRIDLTSDTDLGALVETLAGQYCRRAGYCLGMRM